jgi:hypothetical protein
MIENEEGIKSTKKAKYKARIKYPCLAGVPSVWQPKQRVLCNLEL